MTRAEVLIPSSDFLYSVWRCVVSFGGPTRVQTSNEIIDDPLFNAFSMLFKGAGALTMLTVTIRTDRIIRCHSSCLQMAGVTDTLAI